MNNNAKVPVGVLGASGYVGQELLRLLARHPGTAVAFATADMAAGEWVEGHQLLQADDAPLERAAIVLSALPHGVSARYVNEARAAGRKGAHLNTSHPNTRDPAMSMAKFTLKKTNIGII